VGGKKKSSRRQADCWKREESMVKKGDGKIERGEKAMGSLSQLQKAQRRGSVRRGPKSSGEGGTTWAKSGKGGPGRLRREGKIKRK